MILWEEEDSICCFYGTPEEWEESKKKFHEEFTKAMREHFAELRGCIKVKE